MTEATGPTTNVLARIPSGLGRLERVINLLDMDFSNPEIKQYLILCIYLYKATIQRDSAK